MTQPESRFYPRTFALVTAGVLGFALFRILEPFLSAILWALLLAFLLFPVNRALRRALGGRRGGAALLLTLGATLLVVGPASLLAVAFARQAVELIGRFQAVADRYQLAREADFLGVPVLGRALLWVQARVPVTGADVQAWAVSGAKGLLQTLVSLSGSFFVGALSALVGLAVTLFVLFFFLRDGEELAQRLVHLIPMDAPRKARLVEHLSAVTRAVVLGALLTAVVQGALVGIAFAIGGLPSPVVFGALGAVASLLPLFGSALVWGPGAGVLAMQGRWGAAVFVALWGAVVVSSADNFVRPLFISGRAQISTLPVFLGLMGGIGAFGPIGMFLGPVVVALVLALLRLAEESRGSTDAA